MAKKGVARKHDPMIAKIGQVVRNKRVSLGLRLRQVAKKTGTSVGYISLIELGQVSATIGMLLKVCKSLNLTLSQLMLLADAQDSVRDRVAEIENEALSRKYEVR